MSKRRTNPEFDFWPNYLTKEQIRRIILFHRRFTRSLKEGSEG